MSKLVTYSFSGDYSKTKNFLTDVVNNLRHIHIRSLFNEYGEKIVSALEANTPKRSGATASSWFYEIVDDETGLSLEFHNNNMGSDGKTPVAILIQMGHGTRNGGYVPPVDFINPTVEPLFTELSEKISEVVRFL